MVSLACSSGLATASAFETPKVVFVAPAGDGPGALGLDESYHEPSYPSDFAFDRQDNRWILDNPNNRLQKFGPDGGFLTSWEPEDGAWVVHAGLEVDGSDNVYVGVGTQERFEVRVLDSDGNPLSRYPVEFDWIFCGSPPHLRVTKSGGIVVDTGDYAVFVHSVDELLVSEKDVARVYTFPFADYVVLDRAHRRQRWETYDNFSVTKGPSTQVVFDNVPISEVLEIDNHGNAFVRMRVKEEIVVLFCEKGKQPVRLPDCPKAGRPTACPCGG